jgi:hypothetical protein
LPYRSSKRKRKSAAELLNKEPYQNEKEQGRLTLELAYQMTKENRAAELIIANKELAYQNDEKKKIAAINNCNKELAYQNDEKGKSCS